MELEWSILKEVSVLIVLVSEYECMDVWYDRTVYA